MKINGKDILRRMAAMAAAVLLMAGVSGCDTECYDNQNALPLAKFMTSSAAPEAIALDSIEVYGLGCKGDSVLWNGDRMETLYLPFRVDSDTTSYVFHIMRTPYTDTLTFCYTRSPRLVSEACGVSYIYDIKDIYNTGLFIDSVVCPGGRITNEAVENVIIYFRNE